MCRAPNSSLQPSNSSNRIMMINHTRSSSPPSMQAPILQIRLDFNALPIRPQHRHTSRLSFTPSLPSPGHPKVEQTICHILSLNLPCMRPCIIRVRIKRRPVLPTPTGPPCMPLVRALFLALRLRAHQLAQFWRHCIHTLKKYATRITT